MVSLNSLQGVNLQPPVYIMLCTDQPLLYPLQIQIITIYVQKLNYPIIFYNLDKLPIDYLFDSNGAVLCCMSYKFSKLIIMT